MPEAGGSRRMFNTRVYVYVASGIVSVTMHVHFDRFFPAADANKQPELYLHSKLIGKRTGEGDHFLRIGIRDPSTERTGALDILVREVDALPTFATCGPVTTIPAGSSR